jgi:hypothetical protein
MAHVQEIVLVARSRGGVGAVQGGCKGRHGGGREETLQKLCLGARYR